MSRVVDNLTAYRILSMLVKPFTDTDAFKLGIIDENGHNLIKSSEFETSEQKDAYTYLDRLVFNMKRMLGKLPGGDSKLKNIVAAFFLVKESYEGNSQLGLNELTKVAGYTNSGLTLAEEEILIRDFLLSEDAPANMTGGGVAIGDQPKIKARKFRSLVVPESIFRRFPQGKMRLSSVQERFNLNNEAELRMFNFIEEDCDSVLVLHNGAERKSIKVKR